MSSDYQLEDTIYLPFTTRAFATGIPTALVSGVVDIYEDVTATPIITAETLTVSLNGHAGFNMITVTATAASGFEAGKSYTAILDAGTVDSVSVVGEVVAHFTIEKSAAAQDLANGTDGLGAIKGYVDDIGVAGAGLTALPWNAAWDAQVESEVADALAVFWTSPATLVDLVWDEPLTIGTHNVGNSSGRRLRNVQDFGIYDLASAWVDEVAGTSTGTVDGEDATVTNRADDFDNAVTIAASVGLDAIHIQAGNSITLTATLSGYRIWGWGYTVALGGQSIANTAFEKATITGVGTGADPFFVDCLIGTATLPPCRMLGGVLTDTLTLGSAGAYRLNGTKSGVAGASSPTIDMGAAVGATTLELRDWGGGMTLNNLAAGDVVTLEGRLGTVTLNGADASVEIRGTCKALVNNLTGSPTVNTDGCVFGADVAAILVDTDELQTDDIPGVIAALENISVADILTTQMTEDYAANGVAPTLAQAQFAIHQMLMQFGISGTTITVKKLDNSTAAFLVTLDDGTDPTSAERQ
jgi:hypothetical protein